jgi:hypothetical protein
MGRKGRQAVGMWPPGANAPRAAVSGGRGQSASMPHAGPERVGRRPLSPAPTPSPPTCVLCCTVTMFMRLKPGPILPRSPAVPAGRDRGGRGGCPGSTKEQWLLGGA